jgi:membrane dipeptidase
VNACRAGILIIASLLPPTGVVAQTDAALERARRVLRSAPVIDGHNDLPWEVRTFQPAPGDVSAYDLAKRTPGHTDLARLKEGGVGGQFWSIYIPGDMRDSGYARVQLEQFDIARRIIARYPDHLQLALTAADAEAAIRRGRVASFLGMEGGHAIENSLGALRAYYELGARYMTLTHNVTLDWADAAMDSARHLGLTAFGEEVVREMNRLGMLVDLSHVSPATMSDALNVTQAPVIFSHSSARALADVPRNVPDSILARLPNNGGVVMITFVGGFLSTEASDSMNVWRSQLRPLMEAAADDSARARIRRDFLAAHPLPRVTIAQLANHIEHVKRVAGVDHVALGGDYDGTSELPVGMEDVSRYPYLFAELIRRGWTDDDLRKLANGNILRVLKQAEAVAARLQKTREPSTRTIHQMDRVVPVP